MTGYEFKEKFAYPSKQYIKKNTVNFGDLVENQGGEPKPVITQLDGLASLNNRLKYMGGINQQDRMVFDKRRSLDRALLYSYQAADIKKVQCDDDRDNSDRPNIMDLDEHEVCRALINPDKTKMDYDDKIISVHFEENFHPGDVFEWCGTGSYWMIYLQDLTETAYFRGEIRRCLYEINWEDEDGAHSSYAAVRGPVETKIDYIQKHQISVDRPNYSLHIYLPRNKNTVNYFRRYAKFYLQGDYDVHNTCWRVEAVDSISTDGVLELHAVEYYANEVEDDIENGIVGGLKIKEVSPNTKEEDSVIEGDVFIKPRQIYDYHYKGPLSSWSIVEKNRPVILEVNPKDARHVRLKWDSSYSGQFTLKHGKFEKTIIVESLM